MSQYGVDGCSACDAWPVLLQLAARSPRAIRLAACGWRGPCDDALPMWLQCATRAGTPVRLRRAACGYGLCCCGLTCGARSVRLRLAVLCARRAACAVVPPVLLLCGSVRCPCSTPVRGALQPHGRAAEAAQRALAIIERTTIPIIIIALLNASDVRLRPVAPAARPCGCGTLMRLRRATSR
jgi:hypothetical protein